MTEPITITRASEESPEVRRLALLDDRRALRGPALLASVNGEPRAAVALLDGRAVADPFHPTAEIVEILRFQAGQEVAA
jgi:hypothetical protein